MFKKGIIGYSSAIPGWNLAGAVYDSKSFSLSSQSGNVRGVTFKTDGTKMYMAGGQYIYQYTLSTAWDVSTASYDNVSKYTWDTYSLTNCFFKPDGTKFYLVEINEDRIRQYSLSTPWDISTLTYETTYGVGGRDSTPTAIYFKSDGTKMYMNGMNNRSVFEFSLSTAWDVSTASYVETYAVGTSQPDDWITGLFFKSDGTKMYVSGYGNDRVYQYSLSTPWSISTASYDSVSFSVGSQETQPRSLFFKPDGDKMYVNGPAIYQYSTT